MDTDRLIGLSWVAIRREALVYAGRVGSEALDSAMTLYEHPTWEVRMFAVLVLGALAATDPPALAFLAERCNDDPSWQVNEGLAMAFDRYCAATGYEAALPDIERWLQAPRPNLRRAASEGLRPWTAKGRVYFAAHPQAAIELLGMLKDDESRYVQESAGNALRDIGRKHPELVRTAVESWLAAQPDAKSRRTIARLALKAPSSRS